MATEHPLKQYLHQAREAGMENEEIVRDLTAAGWHMHDIVDIVLDQRPVAGGAPVISVRDLVKKYGTFTALNGVDLDVARGSVTALLGPNGAGKTTLVRTLATLLTPTSGTATVAGFDVVREAQQLRSVIGLAGQYAAVDETLTGRENLEIVGQLYHIGTAAARTRATELLAQFELTDAADRVVKTYSGGMRRRLDLAASLVIHPQVLFLDEPTTGLDPRSRFALWNAIRELVAGGTTVLLTTQYMEEADQLAHHIFVIDHGRIIAQGTAEELKRQVGGDILELHLANHSDAPAALQVVAEFGSGEAHADENGIVTVPVSGGAAMLVDVVRRFDTAGLKLADVMLRRPSLDDVFMNLTGRATE